MLIVFRCCIVSNLRHCLSQKMDSNVTSYTWRRKDLPAPLPISVHYPYAKLERASVDTFFVMAHPY